MELQEIDVYIDKEGRVRLEVRGFRGGQCLEATAELEKSLGGCVERREMTPEASEASRDELEADDQRNEQQGQG